VSSCALITWHATRINVACAVAIIKLWRLKSVSVTNRNFQWRPAKRGT
jgi:hypothetical protein